MFGIPTVNFDAALVTEAVKSDLKKNIMLWPAPGLDDTDLSESSLPFELHRA